MSETKEFEPEPSNSTKLVNVLLHNGSDVAAWADGEEQGPGQKSIGVELCGLRVNRRSGPVLPDVRAGEEALEALHSAIHILQDKTLGH